MVSQHTAENKAPLTTEQHKGETAIPLTFRGIIIPRKIVQVIQPPPEETSRGGSRILVGSSSLCESSFFREVQNIGALGEFDVSH
ncbi:MAG: hypothetical protein WC938_03130 [Candidatus Paceibacterota bacterium]|jgi:hypothetical protein